MSEVNLGLPRIPQKPVLIRPRKRTRKVRLGNLYVGGDAPVTVQSMTTTLTSDVEATLQQIAELVAAGCDIVRVACPSADDADALPFIAKKSPIPVIADIHFNLNMFLRPLRVVAPGCGLTRAISGPLTIR